MTDKKQKDTRLQLIEEENEKKVFLDEKEILKLQNMGLTQDNIKKEIITKQLVIKNISFQIKNLNDEVNIIKKEIGQANEKLNNLVSKNATLVQDLSKKYKLPDKWAFDEISGEVVIFEEEEQEQKEGTTPISEENKNEDIQEK